MISLLENFKAALPTLFVIFCIVLCTVLITRAILMFLLYKAYKKYQKFKQAFPKKFKKFSKKDEELYLKKDDGKSRQSQGQTYQIMESQEQENSQENDMQIVDVVKPIGFFTSMILGQKLTYLIQSAQIINKRGHKGFWVSMVEAQEKVAGRQHGRGR